jgi:hypothetical protein
MGSKLKPAELIQTAMLTVTPCHRLHCERLPVASSREARRGVLGRVILDRLLRYDRDCHCIMR